MARIDRREARSDASDGSTMTSEPEHVPWFLMCALVAVVACQSMAVRIMDLPLNKVIESRYCWDHYSKHNPTVIQPDGNIAEQHCKIDEVQRQLAWLQGTISTLHVLCGKRSVTASRTYAN